MFSSDVLPDNGQLEPCSDYLPHNGFLNSETDPDTTSLPPGLEETDHNDFCHVVFDEYSSMPPIVYLAIVGSKILASLAGKPANKSTFLSCKETMISFCVCGMALALLW